MEVKAYLAILKRRAWIILVATLICISVVTFGFDKLPPVYKASTSLRVLTPIEGGATYTQYQIYYGNRLANTFVQIATSNTVMDELQRRLGIDKLPKITVEAVPDSEIIRITAEDSDPDLAMNAANTLGSIVAAQSMGPYLDATETAPQVLQSRLEKLRGEYEQARKEADDLIPQYSKISAQISILNRSIVAKEQNYQDLRRGYEDAQVAEAIEVFAALRNQQRIKQELLNGKLTQLGAELEKDKSQLESLTIQQNEYLEKLNAAKRAADLKENSYNNLVSQVDLAQIAENIRVNSSGTLVVDQAERPTAPVGPGRLAVMALGALVGLVGGMALAFLVESLDTTVYAVEDIEAITGLPTLGSIPAVKLGPAEKTDLMGAFGDNPSLRESFRTIAASILFSTRANNSRTILVTSAEPMEGKSTFTGFLAIALAQSRRKVIVVDGDMRLARQNVLFHLPNVKGLSDVLAEQVRLDDAIQSTTIKNVDLLSSGTEFANPMELLVGPVLSKTIEALAEKYNYVLVDSPSYLAVVDGEILAEVVQGVILVTRRKESNKDAIRSALRMLADAHAKMIGVVVNSVKPKTRYAYYHRPRSGKLLRAKPIAERGPETPLIKKEGTPLS